MPGGGKFFKLNTPADELCESLLKTGMFDPLEIKIMRAMLMLRQRNVVRSKASTIAKEARMSVTNAYKYLYSLQGKGMIESGKDKNKVFWLSNSANPMPRMFSCVGREYLEKKELFEKLEHFYGRFVPVSGEVWGGEKVYERYGDTYAQRAAFLMDVAKERVSIAAPCIWKDYVLLDALARAAERGVAVQFLAAEADSDLADRLKKMGVDLRVGRGRPFMILVDGMHGMTLDSDSKGMWFLNHKTEYNELFAELWEKCKK